MMVEKKDFVDEMVRAHAPLEGLIELVPEDKLDWAPAKGFMTVGQLLNHISSNWCIVRMLVTQEWPFHGQAEMVEGMKLENMPRSSKARALADSEKDLRDAVRYIEDELSEEDFFSRVVEAPWGFRGPLWRGLLMAKDHFLNHKMQLFLYLKLLGLPVNTRTLYGG